METPQPTKPATRQLPTTRIHVKRLPGGRLGPPTMFHELNSVALRRRHCCTRTKVRQFSKGTFQATRALADCSGWPFKCSTVHIIRQSGTVATRQPGPAMPCHAMRTSVAVLV